MILSLLYFTKKGKFFASIFPGEHYHNEALAFFALNLPSKLHQSVLTLTTATHTLKKRAKKERPL